MVHYGRLCSGKFSPAHVDRNNGDYSKNLFESIYKHWEGVKQSFQLKRLRKFLSVNELKDFILKSLSKKLEAAFFNYINWIEPVFTVMWYSLSRAMTY